MFVAARHGDACRLVRDNHRVLPLKAAPKGTNPALNAYPSLVGSRSRTLVLILTEDIRSDSGWTLSKQLRARIPDANVIHIDPHNAAVWAQPVMDAVGQAHAVIVAVYLGPQGGGPTNTDVLQDAPAALLQSVLERAADKTVVVAMGNPYLAAQWPQVQTYVCTFSDGQASELSAVQAMFGEIPMPGRLPVTIPNPARRGAGLGAPSPTAATDAGFTFDAAGSSSSSGGPQ